MLRAAAYLLLGWGLIALVGGLADVLGITVMLPATSAVLVAHVAFARGPGTPFGLALSIVLGYLEDLHQGAPVGTLTLAHAVAYLVLRWIARRFALGGWPMQAAMATIAVVVIDLTTWATLMGLAESFSVRRDALTGALLDARWHVLATALVAPPLWFVTERFFGALRLVDRPPQHSYWKGK